MEKPSIKPKNPNFSSGPCAKRPGWNFDVLKNTPVGRSHRHKVCKEKLNEVIVKSKKNSSITRWISRRYNDRFKYWGFRSSSMVSLRV